MPIQVTCPGCMSRFTVSEKYAGKKGPCPKCKKEINIPDKSQEVVIHAPEESGPKDAKGKSILKPLRRDDAEFSPIRLGLSIASFLGVVIAAIAIRIWLPGVPTPLIVAGMIGVAPPLILFGYSFLRDSELGGYVGKELWLRTLVCTAAFPATWGVYVFLSYYFENPTLGDTPILQMSIFLPIIIAIGTVASIAAFELEVGQAFLHYVIYFSATLILALIVGIELGEPLKKTSRQTNATPSGLPSPPVGGTPSSPSTTVAP